MNFIHRFSKKASEVTLTIAKKAVGILSPTEMVRGNRVNKHGVINDDGYIRIVHNVYSGFEWGIRLKPFPFSPLEFQATAFTGEAGIRLKLTIPFIVSLGVIIAPRSFLKVSRWFKRGYRLSIGINEGRLDSFNHHGVDPVKTIFEWDLYRTGTTRTCPINVNIVGVRNMDMYTARLTAIKTVKEHRLFPFLNKENYLVSIGAYPLVSEECISMLSIRRGRNRTTEVRNLGDQMASALKRPLPAEDFAAMYDMASVIVQQMKDVHHMSIQIEGTVV